MPRHLDVFLNADLAGCLEQDDHGNLSFHYTPEWLATALAAPLSAALPLRSAPFKRNECRPFFAGLLPEEVQRTMIARTFGISDRNDFAILEKIGAECAGAISLLPPGEIPVGGPSAYREVTPTELAAKMAELPQKPLLAGDVGIRLSLAGAQSKMAVALDNGRYLLPQNGAPSTHILKPQSARFDHLVENEFLCMKLAAAVVQEVAEVSLGTAQSIRFLQVLRYDRKRLPDGTLLRIHQEDFCQALGIPPELKYQQEGGPGLKRCFDLVRAVSAVPAVDVLRLFDAVVFNFLIGNGDAHGKNFSFLHEQGESRLAPLYDLVCTQAFPHLDPQMAMKIGDERDPGKVRQKDWLKFFKEAQVGPTQAIRRMTDLAKRTQESACTWATLHPEDAAVTSLIGQNCTQILSLH